MGTVIIHGNKNIQLKLDHFKCIPRPPVFRQVLLCHLIKLEAQTFCSGYSVSFCKVKIWIFKNDAVYIELCQYLYKIPSETLEMLWRVYSGSIISRSKTCKCYWHFKQGSITDDEHSGQPMTSQNKNNVKILILKILFLRAE